MSGRQEKQAGLTGDVRSASAASLDSLRALGSFALESGVAMKGLRRGMLRRAGFASVEEAAPWTDTSEIHYESGTLVFRGSKET